MAAAVRTAMLIGIFECINWVDILVRRVVLHNLLLELAVDDENFNVPDRVINIDDPGSELTDNVRVPRTTLSWLSPILTYSDGASEG